MAAPAPSLPRESREFVGAADDFASVQVAVLGGEEAFAGAFEHRGQGLQLDLRWVRWRDEVFERCLDVFQVDSRFVFEHALHARA